VGGVISKRFILPVGFVVKRLAGSGRFIGYAEVFGNRIAKLRNADSTDTEQEAIASLENKIKIFAIGNVPKHRGRGSNG
jgi:hypothetical protein